VAQGEWKATSRRIEHTFGILEIENPMTIRQLFYHRLVSKGLMINCQSHYARVSRDLTKARQDGRIPYEWIADRSRPTYMPRVFDDLAGYGRAIQTGYRKNYWDDQSHYVEIWLEKDSVTLEPVTNELGVRMRAARGFNSTTRVHEIAAHLLFRDPYCAKYMVLRRETVSIHDNSRGVMFFAPSARPRVFTTIYEGCSFSPLIDKASAMRTDSQQAKQHPDMKDQKFL
jgi:hypothetical protein